MTTELNTIDDVVDLILLQWQQHDLSLGNQKRKNILKMTDKMLEVVNSHLKKPPVYMETPLWLPAIDAYFLEQMRKCRLNKFTVIPQWDSEFVAVCVLLTPLVYFDEVLRMQSFDDGFIHRIELAFMTRFNVPRDVEEGRRMYNAILQMPETCHLVSQMVDKTVAQPFRAQMMFASLIMHKSEPQSDVWQFQKHCLETCPAKLLDYPGYPTSPGDAMNLLSPRPAFWMANFVEDSEFRRILQQRASDVYRDNLAQVLAQEEKLQKSKADVSTEQQTDTQPLIERAAMAQQPLAIVLKALDEYLVKHAPELHAGLHPGVNSDQLQKLNQALAPLQIPQDLALLYQWHNGVDYNGYLFGFPDFLPLEDALLHYREAVELGEEFSWSKVWYTFCYGGQDYRLVSLSETSQQQSPVFSLFLQDGQVTQQFDSIQSMIETYLEAYQTGVIAYNPDDAFWDTDEEKLETLRRKHNPQSYTPGGESRVYDTYQTADWPPEWRKYYIGQPL